ncbi:hypothetical protein Pint_03799 [Pistacia integerrima]|uniref:Uncharacterized protein n=1 Tax=Pistacia integerrima TaxID=434235 RepID=A0ACC0Z5V3_9ROSI|nr:hypothetical protein Pint_03799 [Pistacia integerrima]
MASATEEDGVVPQVFSVEKHQTEIKLNEDEEFDDNPIEEVRLTVPITDDPTEPVLTFRTWVLGIASCCILAFLNRFFGYRQNQLSIGSVSAQIIVLPVGKLMAAALPKTPIRIPLTPWSFSLNPGPFTLKEHVLITIFASCGSGGVYAVHIITIVKAFYHKNLHPVAALLLAQTTQLLGYGWAGLFRKYLVDSPYMWWPANLVQVSLFRALHDKDKRPKGGLSRLQFFFLDSITANQLGAGLNGLGIGSFGLDWSTVAGFLGSPLATPFFATLTATISHVALFDGSDIWRMWKMTTGAVRDKLNDVHTRIMKKNYAAVPQWWFHIILILTVALSIFACEGFDAQLQLPWWGLLLACAIALFFTLPIGIIQATTNQQPGLNVITELIIGYMYPGRPLANVTFKTYGYISMSQALSFLEDFKLGHYMKIPPRSMFIVQLTGTIVSSTVYFATAWWLLVKVDHICDTTVLPASSPWTCPGDDVFYSASIIWGIVGPGKMFTNQGVYPEMNWFFLIGLLAPVPVWYFSRKFPEKKWIKLINFPIIFGGTGYMPPARAVHYLSWGAVGIFFNYYLFRRHKRKSGPDWWGAPSNDHCPLAKCPTAAGIEVKGCPLLH